MKTLKQLFLLCLFGMMSIGAWADEGTMLNNIYIYPYVGNPVALLLSDKPQIQYQGDEMIVNYSNSTIAFKIPEIRKISFMPNVVVSIPSLEQGKEQQSDKILIYTTSGILVKTIGTGQKVDFDSLIPGLYIIKKGNSSITFQKH